MDFCPSAEGTGGSLRSFGIQSVTDGLMKKFLLIFPIIQVLLGAPCSAKTLKVPDDFQTIRAAIEVAGEGDRVIVSPGTYRERVSLKANMTLTSVGNEDAKSDRFTRAKSTILDGSGVDGERSGVVMAEGSVLDGFTVTGIGAFDEALWKKHWEERGQNQKHDDIGTFGVPAIAVDGISCRIQNCLVHHNGHTGIGLRGQKGVATHPLVIGNRCWRNMGGGIGVMDGASGIVQENECFENLLAGIGHSGEAAPLVMGNDCHDNVRAGIGVSEGACPIVRGNCCHSNRRAGIGIRTGSETRPVVEGNRCFENGMAGIGVEDDAEPLLRQNKCEKNQLAGIGTENGVKAILVANECRENQASGIGLNTGCEAVLWRNICEDNALVALGIPEKGRAIVVENVFSRRGGVPPLVAIKGGSAAIMTGNKLRGGGVAGILLEGRGVIEGNRIEGGGEKATNGIWLWKGSEAFGVENVVHGFQHPLTVTPGAEWSGTSP